MTDPAVEAAQRVSRHERSALMPKNTVRYHNGHFHRGSGECLMTDPAVEAAQRAYAREPRHICRPGLLPAMEAAAREALKPIRELHRPHAVVDSDWFECVGCLDYWPCDTAKLAYPESELR